MINETITVLICFNFLHHFGIQTLLCQTNQRNRCIGAYKHSFFTYSLQNTHFILKITLNEVKVSQEIIV